MRKLRVIEFVSLDGVMQAPGGPQEDTEGGFQHGGWVMPYQDEVFSNIATESMKQTDAYLFGRKTYEIFSAYWPTASVEIPFTGHLNSTAKYVASRTLERADWQNSTIMKGELADEVANLKAQPGKNIAVLGSGELVRSLLAHDLVDEFFLTVIPVLLGSGKKLFQDSQQVKKLQLQDSTVTTTGALILTYVPAT